MPIFESKFPPNRLYLLREEKGITQSELGVALGISESSVARHEGRSRAISPSLVQMYARYFGVSLVEIYEEIGKTQGLDSLRKKEDTDDIDYALAIAQAFYPNDFVDQATAPTEAETARDFGKLPHDPIEDEKPAKEPDLCVPIAQVLIKRPMTLDDL